MNPIKCSVTLCASLAGVAFAAWAQERQHAELGKEISIPRHLQDGEEFEIPISRLIQFGEQLFTAGYKSARSFSRAVRRACGLTPEEFRSFLLKEQSAAV